MYIAVYVAQVRLQSCGADRMSNYRPLRKKISPYEPAWSHLEARTGSFGPTGVPKDPSDVSLSVIDFRLSDLRLFRTFPVMMTMRHPGLICQWNPRRRCLRRQQLVASLVAPLRSWGRGRQWTPGPSGLRQGAPRRQWVFDSSVRNGHKSKMRTSKTDTGNINQHY